MPKLKKSRLDLACIVIEQFGTRALNFATFIIVARHSSLENLGQIGLAWTLLNFFETFTATSLMPAYMRHHRDNLILRSTYFWICLASGAVILILTLLLSHHLPILKTQPGLTAVLDMVGVIFLLKMLGNAHVVTLVKNKHLLFHAKNSLSAALLGSLTGIILALAGWGIWALLIRTAVTTGLKAAGSLFFKPWCPVFRFHKRTASGLVRFSKTLVSGQLGRSFLENSRDAIAASLLGIAELGRITVAKRIPAISFQTLLSINSSFLFPRCTPTRLNAIKAMELFRRVAQVGLVFGLLAAVAIFPTGGILLSLVFGDTWRDAGLLFTIFCLYLVSNYTRSTLQTILTARGYPKTNMIEVYWGFAFLPIFVLACFSSSETAFFFILLQSIICCLHTYFTGSSLIAKTAPTT